VECNSRNAIACSSQSFPEIDWRTGEVKMTRYLEECRKQRPKQGKLGWKRQKKEENKEENKKKRSNRRRKKRKRRKNQRRKE